MPHGHEGGVSRQQLPLRCNFGQIGGCTSKKPPHLIMFESSSHVNRSQGSVTPRNEQRSFCSNNVKVWTAAASPVPGLVCTLVSDES